MEEGEGLEGRQGEEWEVRKVRDLWGGRGRRTKTTVERMSGKRSGAVLERCQVGQVVVG